MVEVQGGLARLLGTNMLRDLIDILHQFHRTAEGIGVDILKKVRLGLTVRLEKLYLIGLVHITNTDDLMANISTLDTKSLADFRQFPIQIHGILSKSCDFAETHSIYIYFTVFRPKCQQNAESARLCVLNGVYFCRYSRATRAASCSARFLLLPTPLPITWSLRLTSTRNSLSWSGPDCPTST